MKLDNLREELSQHIDFKDEKTLLEHFLHNKGHACLFLPKLHCELNPIERCWGEAKRYTRAYTNYTIQGLRKTIPKGLDSVTLDNIQNFFRKSRDYMFAYLQGHVAGNLLEEKISNSYTMAFSGVWNIHARDPRAQRAQGRVCVYSIHRKSPLYNYYTLHH